MDGVVSPYDLSERSHGAMAALMLCDRCVTFLPVRPEEVSEAGIERAAGRVARFARLLEHWKWSMELWEEGVLSAAGADGGGRTLYEEVMGAREQMARAPALASLLGKGIKGSRDQGIKEEGEEGFLERASRDLVRGGGDPGVSVPVMAGLERFAAGRGLWLFQSPASSMVGRLEGRMGRVLFTTSAPFPSGAGGEAILTARALLEEELGGLGSAMEESLAMVRAGASAEEVRAFGREVIEPAAGAYEAAFAARADEFMWGVGERRGAVQLRITCTQMPPDATLAAAACAASVVLGGGDRGIRGSREQGEGRGAETGIASMGAVAVSVKALPWDVGAQERDGRASA